MAGDGAGGCLARGGRGADGEPASSPMRRPARPAHALCCLGACLGRAGPLNQRHGPPLPLHSPGRFPGPAVRLPPRCHAAAMLLLKRAPPPAAGCGKAVPQGQGGWALRVRQGAERAPPAPPPRSCPLAHSRPRAAPWRPGRAGWRLQGRAVGATTPVRGTEGGGGGGRARLAALCYPCCPAALLPLLPLLPTHLTAVPPGRQRQRLRAEPLDKHDPSTQPNLLA